MLLRPPYLGGGTGRVDRHFWEVEGLQRASFRNVQERRSWWEFWERLIPSQRGAF